MRYEGRRVQGVRRKGYRVLVVQEVQGAKDAIGVECEVFTFDHSETINLTENRTIEQFRNDLMFIQ